MPEPTLRDVLWILGIVMVFLGEAPESIVSVHFLRVILLYAGLSLIGTGLGFYRGKDIGIWLFRRNLAKRSIGVLLIVIGVVLMAIPWASHFVEAIMLIVGEVVLIAGISALISWCYGYRYPYMTYKPKPIPVGISEVSIPNSAMVKDVPWLAIPQKGVGRCQTNLLLMAARKYGARIPDYVATIALRYTLGIMYQPDSKFLFSGNDPERGFPLAAEALGLTREFYISNDPELFIHALKYYLSQDFPVKINVMPSVLYQLERKPMR